MIEYTIFSHIIAMALSLNEKWNEGELEVTERKWCDRVSRVGEEDVTDNATLLLEDAGAVSQEMQVVSRGWKRQGNALFPKASKRDAALLMPHFSPLKPTLDFGPTELWDDVFLLL